MPIMLDWIRSVASNPLGTVALYVAQKKHLPSTAHTGSGLGLYIWKALPPWSMTYDQTLLPIATHFASMQPQAAARWQPWVCLRPR